MAQPRLTPETRTTAFYFSYFMGPGAAVMFLPIWLSEKGISTEQIGIINAVPVFIILALNLVVGRLADKASDWRQVIVIGALIAGVVPIGLFFVNEFWGILLFWTLAALPGGAIGPVLDAATMRMARRNGSDFATIRAWGTVGYMMFNALTGFLVVWFGSAIFVPLFVGLALLRAAVSLQLPAFRAPPEQATVSAATPSKGKLREIILQPWFSLPLLGFAMVFGTHQLIGGFGALIWKEQGISESIIGPLIALGSLSETAVMFVWKRFGSRVSARQLMLICAGVALLRWLLMAFSPPVWALLLLQMLHGFTFALGFLGCVHFIANWTSEDIAAEAQSLFTVLQQMTSVVALIGFGALVGWFGPYAYLGASVAAGLGGLCIWLSLRMKQPKEDAIATG
ncbi:MFS transporter, PPP family, 3-phenylpropionic acid transporter [Devosia sp. YR412]|uniref:MFS transporter n=1 Tax=Devosia sp. YR412 TaxID=1881030 RepID=UPI0008AFCD6A|nr:MFS transporter [Devosia sp. YR412]SEP99551.1 MFS transporter, PPP family, 3-phenylpropionic acid transporter [Devosia sp. YR412]